ncbi:DUF4184 family protein [Streptomyces sp. NPDC056600]|uniref:DUF4184 family protein n=1 Tax=Streptomyces sp. NPDC056600 TaxID=3345874 RepID=UPI003675DC7E
MPFTLSHAVAVLPAMRADGTGRAALLVPSVMVAGSFAPDMTYYAASALPDAMVFGDVTHSFAGVLTVDAAIAWLLVGAWLLLREPLVALLPRRVRGRAAVLTRCGTPRARLRPRPAAAWYLSAVLGALTHVVWDAFTHLDQWGMRVFPVLGEEIAGSPLYWYMQYGGSAVAAVVIVWFLVRALRRSVPHGGGHGSGEGFVDGGAGLPELSRRDRWAAGALLALCAGFAATTRVMRWWAYWGHVARPWEIIPTLCFGAGAGLAVGLVLYGTAVRVWRRPPRGPRAAAGGTEAREATGSRAAAPR